MVNLRSLNAYQRRRRRLSAPALHTASIKRFAQRACRTERPRVRRRYAAPPCSRSSSLLRRLRICCRENRAGTPGRIISAVAPHANSGDDVWRRQLPCPPAGSRNGVTRGTLHGSFFCAQAWSCVAVPAPSRRLTELAGPGKCALQECQHGTNRHRWGLLSGTLRRRSTILFCVRRGVRGSRFANSVLLID